MSSKRPPDGLSRGFQQTPKHQRRSKRCRPGKPKVRRNHAVNIDGLAPQLHEQWKAWPELTIHLEGLPTSVTTSNLWDWFSHEGEIAYMDIYETQRNPNISNAKIRFEPPPERNFWYTGSYIVRHHDRKQHPKEIEISIKLSNHVPPGFLKSPVHPDRTCPVKLTLYPAAIHFGSLTGENSMKIMKSIPGMGNGRSLKLEVNPKYQRLTAFFPVPSVVGGNRTERQHKVVIDFASMKNVYQTATADNCCTFVVPLKIPPQYYWKAPNIHLTFSDEAKNWSVMESWNRATNIVQHAGLPMMHPVTLHNDFQDPEFVDIGRWTTIGFVLDGGTEIASQVNQQLVTILDDFNISTKVQDDFKTVDGTKAKMWEYIDHQAPTEGHNALQMLQYSRDSVIHLPFDIRYQLEVCLSRGYLNEHMIEREFLERLANMKPAKARLCLETVADNAQVVVDPMAILEESQLDGSIIMSRVPSHCCLIRKAVITPTTIRYTTPTVEMSNRVMRRYKHYEDRFLKVQFTEEMEKGRIAVNKDQNDEIYKRVLRSMYKGVRIGDRLYEFLAFGNSQLRVNGAYFFCPTEHLSCDDIRRWMGQFSHIKVVAKYAARLGQCFSTTRELHAISAPATRQIPDIERNGHCFTDGIGKISSFLAQLISEDMILDVIAQPSAFQFRMGGCKGVLAIWPNDTKVMEVHIRESQKKFESDSKGLEIIRSAAMATATLNRQTITILECLGVPIASFTNLLDHQLRSYELAMEDNDVAIDMLTKFVDENSISDLLRAGFKTDDLQEPFVVNVLKLWRSWSLKLLKEKARIQVQKSAFVLGCVDETGTLRGHSSETEGSEDKDIDRLPQIFIQLSDATHYNKTQIISGVCIIGRNPSLHPGDIRVVEAVDCPALHHLRDVVVFPSTGDQPVPNMLSGGDLDGDDFFVIWEPTLIPKRWNYPPMNYSAPKPIELDRDVTVDDLRNFFVKYLKNDKLPLIATSHLAFSDELGPMSSKCLELAELHSKAVDYPKTGDPAVLRRDQQPRKWPHFMEKKNSYNSRKALGIIFDKVKGKQVKFDPIWDSPFDQRIITKFELDRDILKSARKIKTQYDTSVRRLLSQHALKTEFELWTGFAMSRPAVGSDYKVQEELRREYTNLKGAFRQLCIDTAGSKSAEKLEPFVAAMYKVTDEEMKIALYEHHRGVINDTGTLLQPRKLEPKSMPLISFPWIFHREMCRMANSSDLELRTLLAAGPRQGEMPGVGEHLEPTVKNDATPVKHEVPEVSDLAPEIHSRLPDGTVLHRGQPLAIFPLEDDAVSDVDDDSPNGISGSGQSSSAGIDSGMVSDEQPDISSENVMQVEVPSDDDDVVEDDTDSIYSDELGEDEEEAMDRLVNLMSQVDAK
ncbi:probable RNA-dependent RNA polymerase (RdRP) SAD-1 [Fusarium fujikuroi IMI 58289]|uniref:RNA-dependent RNA polymerase n=1 Tax=Gibberella fujikuroi (strain CBS 195.34 / IMI 58289 / NRRL A-6831) TaxID=1279085 RepID=S0E6G3_GIBF5|nr:probable RNA-dependent RNA polymerase (RdRP) SAD-1 [Fusarium fujikuroi IMI 58289]CCT70275.1 probable RNA-dependent RNA polymerase (RdRP) SAD-1 [Fusarium fujikuroi IMI 58289]SCN84516.1 probable RNA-dependent RNA polymerase (RdRP) SAD-1 [Fusarium fujikuroi]SCO48839.1 probable RNA-dependent RNA polymerase (RdRP) SAD-1 [Fusarium fujikuroi]